MPDTDKVVYVTAPGRAVYPHVFKPAEYRNSKPGQKLKFEITLLFRRSDPVEAKCVKELLAMQEQYLKERWPKGIPNNVQRPVKPADVTKYGQFGYTEKDFQVKFKTEFKPQVIDQRKRSITEESGDLYGGCWCRVSCTPYSYDKDGGRGMSFGLGNVQKVRDDEPILGGGGTRAEDDFDFIEIADPDMEDESWAESDLLS